MDEKQIPQPCDEWAELLSTAQFDDLPTAHEKALGVHLLECSQCSAVWTDYRFLRDSLRRSLTVEPLPGLPSTAKQTPSWSQRFQFAPSLACPFMAYCSKFAGRIAHLCHWHERL
jgi:hypothetical protein